MHSFNTCYVLSSTLGDTKTKNYKAPPPVRGHCVGLGPPLAGRIGCRAGPCSPCSNALAADGYTVTRTSKHSCHGAEESPLVTGAPCPPGSALLSSSARRPVPGLRAGREAGGTLPAPGCPGPTGGAQTPGAGAGQWESPAPVPESLLWGERHAGTFQQFS